jgi:hypothetical protein
MTASDRHTAPPRDSEAFVHEIFVMAPAKVRWVAGDITVEEDYLEMIAQQQTLWELRKMERNSTLYTADQPSLSAIAIS